MDLLLLGWAMVSIGVFGSLAVYSLWCVAMALRDGED